MLEGREENGEDRSFLRKGQALAVDEIPWAHLSTPLSGVSRHVLWH